MSLRILTFNWHESYIHLLSKTGHDFDVVERTKAGVHGWLHAIRPVPPNCRLVNEREARNRLARGAYDRIIAHNLDDLMFVRDSDLPKVLLFHNKLSTEIALAGGGIDKKTYQERVRRLLDQVRNVRCAFVSEAKRRDWGLQGEIVLPGIDSADYGGYQGEVEEILRIGNGLKERDLMLGYTVQERIVRGLPTTILGLNRGMPDSRLPPSWDAYREFLRSRRVYLNTTQEPYEDGYNLAMLEAMATGMPVVSTANASSPIENRLNGFISADEAEVRAGLEALLKDPSLAALLGEHAKQTVLDRFPIRRFVDRWSHLLEDRPVARSRGERKSQGRLRILMSYASNPITTAAYLEKALRKSHDVITYGPQIESWMLKAWDLEGIRQRIRPHDIPYFTKDAAEVFRRLPAGWKPDLFLWVETGVEFPLEGLERLPCPTACYLIDTHLHLHRHLQIARQFDCVFLAQKAYVAPFREEGIEEVYWLPLACDPHVHKKFHTGKDLAICFVGSVVSLGERRNRLLLGLAERFPVYLDRCFLEEMALVFSRSKIVFNCSVRNDLNMRVFEALATGSLLVTDEAPGSGLGELFEDGRHLVLFRDEDALFEKVEHYLKNPSEREAIATAGRQEVLARHTYDHRAEQLVEKICMLSEVPIRRTGQARQSERKGEEACLGNDRVLASRPTGYYRKARHEIAALVPAEAARILDVGCGAGGLGRVLKSGGQPREVWGVEIEPNACEEASRWLDRVALADAAYWEPPVEHGYFDVLVFADILEHLPDPRATLERYLPWLNATGSVVMSIPNIRFWSVVKHLAEGYWTYQDEGLLDRGHLRFFTWREILRLLEACSLTCAEVRWNLDPRCPRIADGRAMDLRLGRITIHHLGPEEVREFFVFQYLVRAVRDRKALVAEASHLEGSGKLSEAFKVYACLAERDPGDGRIAEKLVETSRSSEERERAASLLEEAVRLHPANIDLLLLAARTLLRGGRRNEARERLERILLLVPDHREARSTLEGLICP